MSVIIKVMLFVLSLYTFPGVILILPLASEAGSVILVVAGVLEQVVSIVNPLLGGI